MQSKDMPGPPLHIAVVLLAAASGALESVSFLGLNHVFAGVMTSNLALLGMAAGRGEAMSVTAALLALTGFGLGALIGARSTARASTAAATRWPWRIMGILAAETVLLAGGALVWGLAGGTPGTETRDIMQFGAGLAMGAQSAAMVSAGHAAAPTTYLTGTLATYIDRAAHGGRQGIWVPLRFAGLIAGAATSAVLLKTARAWAALPPVVLMVCAIMVACTAQRPPARLRRPSTTTD